MSFNNGYERKLFNRQQERQAAQYRKAGMSEESIQAMFVYDHAGFCLYRREKEHAIEPSAMIAADDCTGDTRYMDMDELPAKAPLIASTNRYAWIDELENEEMAEAIRGFSDDYKEIMTLLFEGFKEREIAQMRGVVETAIINKVTRIRKRLKKFE